VNRIFLEHTRELGDTLQKIAEDKSAIITGSQKAVFVSEQEPEVMEVLEKRAEICKVPLFLYGRDFRAENIVYTEQGMCFDVVTPQNCYKEIRIPLLGTYQAKNCALALALCEKILMETLKEKEVKSALRKLEWPGRLEVLSSNPLMLLDACINRESCKNVLEALGQLVQKRVITIIGIPSDKDYLGVAEAMHGISAKLILTKSQNAHYKFGPDQVVHLQERGIESVWTESIAEAVEKAREYIQETGNYELPICILGTTSLISDVKVLASTPKGIQDEKKYGI
jgi:dihydrofolate synthase/folylpolyglutamate synthase